MKHNFLAWRLLDAGLDKSGGAILEAIEKNHKTTTEQIEAVKTQQQKSLEESNKMIVDLKGELKVVKDEGDKLRDEIKEFKAKAKTSGMFGGTGLKSFEAEIEEKLTENKEKLGKGQTFDVELNRKAVGDMSSATNLSGTIVPADTRTGIIINPYADYHMRNVIQVGRTSSDNVRHLRDNGGEGGPTTVAESATKPQMDRDLISADAPVRKIATYLRVPEEMIEDIPYITTFLTNIGTEEVLKVEDQQVIYGAGTGTNLTGLFTAGTAFTGAGATFPDANRFDVLRAARTQMRIAKRKPTAILVSPLDYLLMTSEKDANGNYILLGGGNGIIPNVDGVPIIENTELEDGDFLLVDRNAAEMVFRSNLSVRFYDQDRDNAIKNMVTIVIEERLALPIYYVNGIVKGAFDTAIAAITPAP